MLDTIKNILNGDQYPLLKSNLQEGYVYRQFLDDTANIVPNFTPIYKVEFKNIEHHTYKVRYYFRIITNDIYTTLNHIFSQSENKSALQVQYQHQNFKQIVEEYIFNFHSKLQSLHLHPDFLQVPPKEIEQEKFAIIAYYAIASLATAYLQYINHFLQHLTNKELPTTPQEFIFDTLQTEFPKEIIIKDQNVQTSDIVTEPKRIIVQGDYVAGDKKVDSQINKVEAGGIGAKISNK